jgi:glucose-1-phosphate cytidylyltransferase
MKAVILAGGLGTRISEETHLKPKPMIEIGGKPILWHIMKIYSAFGINEFVICLGYKGYIVKEYFANYYRHMSDITFDLSNNSEIIHNNNAEKWKVTLVDTGDDAMTGARIKKIYDYIKNDKAFCLTYGDGVANINIADLIKFHKSHGKLATLTATQPPGRFGALTIDDNNNVMQFQEKPEGDGNFINGGFFVLSPKIIDYIADGDDAIWEQESLKNLAKDGNLAAFKHTDFWQPMDTLRDKTHLENLWHQNKAPWKIW